MILVSALIAERPRTAANKAVKSFTQCYFDLLAENSKKKDDIVEEVVDFYGKTATMEDRIRQVCSTIDNLVNEEHIENENGTIFLLLLSY